MVVGKCLSKNSFIYNLDPSGPSENKCQPGRKAFPHSTRERLCESEVKDNIALFDSLLRSIYFNAQVHFGHGSDFICGSGRSPLTVGHALSWA